MASSKRPANAKPLLTIAVCGGTGSGKSWLARHLVRHLSGQAVVLCQDWYYRDHSRTSDAECEKLNFDHPSAIETPLMLKQLRALLAGKTIQTPRYRYSTHSRDQATRALAIIVFVGVQPSLTQVPPKCSCSMRAVLRPARDRAVDNGPPPCPAPITMES